MCLIKLANALIIVSIYESEQILENKKAKYVQKLMYYNIFEGIVIMYTDKFAVVLSLISLLIMTVVECQLRWKYSSNESILKTIEEELLPQNVTSLTPAEHIISAKHKRETGQNASPQMSMNTEFNNDGSEFKEDEIGWSNVNEEVDMVIPMVIQHLRKLGIEHWRLPDMKEAISLNSLLIPSEVGLFLTNGIVYNIAGIQRYGDALMTYESKSFLTRFNILIKSLQFEYNFLAKIMRIEGYGRIVGALEDTVVFAELVINVADIKFKLNDFRIMKFGNIQVQLDQSRLIRHLTSLILSPITNLFRDRITTSISDGLKDQMQSAMDDFNESDPLQLKKFAEQIISSLTGLKSN